MEAAKKAIYAANQYKIQNNFEAIELNLFVDAEWLTYQDHYKQKGYVLSQMALKNNIILNVKHISGKDNPADKYTLVPSENEVKYMKLDVSNIY